MTVITTAVIGVESSGANLQEMYFMASQLIIYKYL